MKKKKNGRRPKCDQRPHHRHLRRRAAKPYKQRPQSGNMSTANSTECDYCGEDFDNVGARLAHQKHKCPERPKKEQKNDSNSQNGVNDTGTEFNGEEYPFYAGEVEELTVIDLDEPKALCSNCGEAVRPGTNCEACGEELEWP